MREAFENPANGHVEVMPRLPWLKALVAGPLFFALRGAWAHALIALPLWAGGWCIIVLGFSALFSMLGASSPPTPKRGPAAVAWTDLLVYWPVILGAAIHASLARRIVRKVYLRRGWRTVQPNSYPQPVHPRAKRIEPSF